MTRLTFSLGLLAALAIALAVSRGCAWGGDVRPAPVLVPAGGRVTLDGVPVATAVVTFLQIDEFGTTSGGETDADGRFRLTYANAPGTAAGPYKVAISYLVGRSGKPLGRRARSSKSHGAEINHAIERFPPHYSDLGQTRLRATVPPQGGTFDFDLKGPILDPPENDKPS